MSNKKHLPAQENFAKWAAHAKLTIQVGNLLVLRTPVEPCKGNLYI